MGDLAGQVSTTVSAETFKLLGQQGVSLHHLRRLRGSPVIMERVVAALKSVTVVPVTIHPLPEDYRTVYDGVTRNRIARLFAPTEMLHDQLPKPDVLSKAVLVELGSPASAVEAHLRMAGEGIRAATGGELVAYVLTHPNRRFPVVAANGGSVYEVGDQGQCVPFSTRDDGRITWGEASHVWNEGYRFLGFKL